MGFRGPLFLTQPSLSVCLDHTPFFGHMPKTLSEGDPDKMVTMLGDSDSSIIKPRSSPFSADAQRQLFRGEMPTYGAFRISFLSI